MRLENLEALERERERERERESYTLKNRCEKQFNNLIYKFYKEQKIERENYANMLFNIRSKHNALFSRVKNSLLRNYIKAISTNEEACSDEN